MASVSTKSSIPVAFVASIIRNPPSISGENGLLNDSENLPWWRGDTPLLYKGPEFLGINRAGIVSGTVFLDEIPVPDALVFLFYLPTMLLIRTGRTDENGAYLFDGLDKTSNRYVAVTRVPPHNAMILDTLTPA